MCKNYFAGFFKRLAAMLSMLLVTTSFVFAQSGISIDVKDAPLRTVMSTISQQSNYRFVYTDAINVDSYKVSVTSVNEPAKVLFDKIFVPLKIRYKLKGRQVVLGIDGNQREPQGGGVQSVVSAPQTQSGKTKITGKVYDFATGEPLAGAFLRARSGGTALSDSDGNFMINAIDGEDINCTFLGMKDISFKASAKRQMNVLMRQDIVSLQDVLVTGYQTISKERATGSFNILKQDQIERPTTNIAQRLVGTTAGLQSKVDANGDVTFEIRGQTSLMTDAQPLIVVDGFAIQDDFNSINPNDVESITVLKDAAAASIWGARSANGVIVITTKRGHHGKKGDVLVDVKTFWKYSPKIDWGYANPLASSAETVEYEQKAFQGNGYFGGTSATKDANNAFQGNSLAVTAINEHRLGYLSEEEMNAVLDKLKNQNNEGQIKRNMLDNPFTRQYNVAISQSTDRQNSTLSLMYEHRDMYLKGNNQGKYNIGYRTTVKLFKWLDFNFSGNYSLTRSKNNALSYAQLASMSPYQMLVNEDGTRNYDIMGDGYRKWYYSPNILRYVPTGKFPYSDWSYNPISEREGKNFKTNRTGVRAQAGLTFHIIKGLDVDTKLQYERVDAFEKDIYGESTMYVRQTINEASSWDKTTNTVTANLPKGGIMDQSKASVDSYNWRNQVNYNKSFGANKLHQISAIAGTEISNIVSQETDFARTYGYNNETLTVGTFPNGVGGSGNYKLTNWLGKSERFSYTNEYTYNTERYFSMYANVSYTYNKRYTLSGSIRTDASNMITDDPKYRYSPFWSIGASWIASDESFMKNISWLDRLVIRATVGYNGNVDRTTSYLPLINVSTTQNSYIQDYTATIGSYGNPTLSWEKTGTIDVGVDYSMFKGKLYGKADFYNKHGKDLIVGMSISSVNGTKSQKLNEGQMDNRGVEMEFGSSMKIMGNDITWSGSLNFSYNFNKITNLFKSVYTAEDLYYGFVRSHKANSYVQGYNANEMWAYKYMGVKNFGTDAEPKWRPVVQGPDGSLIPFSTSTIPGDARAYMVAMGTRVAPYSLGLSSTFKIFDFNLSFIFTGKFGHKFNGFSFNYPDMVSTSGQALPNKAYKDVVNSTGDKVAPIPWDGETGYSTWKYYYPYLDYLVERAGHIRCQEVNLTYNVPARLLSRLRIKKAEVYAQGNNLFIITNNKYNEDPEYPLGSIKPTASYTFGINLTF